MYVCRKNLHNHVAYGRCGAEYASPVVTTHTRVRAIRLTSGDDSSRKHGLEPKTLLPSLRWVPHNHWFFHALPLAARLDTNSSASGSAKTTDRINHPVPDWNHTLLLFSPLKRCHRIHRCHRSWCLHHTTRNHTRKHMHTLWLVLPKGTF